MKGQKGQAAAEDKKGRKKDKAGRGQQERSLVAHGGPRLTQPGQPAEGQRAPARRGSRRPRDHQPESPSHGAHLGPESPSHGAHLGPESPSHGAHRGPARAPATEPTAGQREPQERSPPRASESPSHGAHRGPARAPATEPTVGQREPQPRSPSWASESPSHEAHRGPARAPAPEPTVGQREPQPRSPPWARESPSPGAHRGPERAPAPEPTECQREPQPRSPTRARERTSVRCQGEDFGKSEKYLKADEFLADSVSTMMSGSTDKGSLSVRGLEITKRGGILEQGLSMCLEDPYDKILNVKGFINLGTSENRLCFDLLHERLTRADMHHLDPYMLQYNDPRGIKSTRQEIARFLTDYCQASGSLNPENIILMNGCGAIFSALSTAICNPGDGFLIPAPYYTSIDIYTSLYSGIKPVHVPLSSKLLEGESYPFQLTIQKLEDAMEQGKKQGIQIKALIVVNPQNPFGGIYSDQLLIEMLNFGHRHSLHVVVDEIYMLSIFDNSTFRSVLSFHNVPDPERTHFIWGFSKDLAMNGMRIGMLYTRNQQLCNSMSRLACLHQCPGPTQYMISQLLKDRDWLDNVFFPTNKQRLKESQKILVNGLQDLGIPVIQGSAGLYVWADFRKFMKSQTFEAEMELWMKLIKEKVYIAPGKAFECYEPGWFRLTFSLTSDILEICIQKLHKIINPTPKMRYRLISKGSIQDDVTLLEDGDVMTLVNAEKIVN
ncbi:1-aminocyclopropane-1-carboxylate synthase-like protein 1 [Discoglossus pictus]